MRKPSLPDPAPNVHTFPPKNYQFSMYIVKKGNTFYRFDDYDYPENVHQWTLDPARATLLSIDSAAYTLADREGDSIIEVVCLLKGVVVLTCEDSDL